MSQRLGPVVILALLLAACGSAPASPASAPTAAPASVQTPTSASTAPSQPTANVQATVEAAVKATMSAAPSSTATLQPTAAPIPTKPLAEPTKPAAAVALETSASKWTSMQVVEAFKAAGLEVGEAKAMGRQDYGLAPLIAVEATRFLIPSLCSDGQCGGRVFTFAKEGDRDQMKTYYESHGRAGAALYSHVFVRDLVLVQINGELKDQQAAKYEAALKGIA